MQKNCVRNILNHTNTSLRNAVLPVSSNRAKTQLLRLRIAMRPKNLGGINAVVGPDGLHRHPMTFTESLKLNFRGQHLLGIFSGVHCHIK
jgi:hypothetical protein